MTETPQQTRRAKVLKALQAAGRHGITNGQLGEPDVGGHRFSARVMELRAEGWVIEQRRMGPSVYRYWLRGAPAGVPLPTPDPIETREPARLFALPAQRHYETWSDVA